VSAFTNAIDEYFSMIVPELEKILELAAGSHIPEHLRDALKTAMLNQAAALSGLKVDLRLGTDESLQNIIRRSQILQMELQTLRKYVADRFSCLVPQIVEKTLQQNRCPGVEYRLDLPAEEGIWARIPGYALSQIVENCLDNAHAAVSAMAHKRITIELEANADYLFLRIRDNGPGVPAAIAERLFSERVSTKSHAGGFGLHYAHTELVKFGGAIRLLDQEAGQGATFEIMLKRIDHE
ncbi:MAG TPA: ATP-binding protein, partial [bacterium]|nr:ATP-binding protein [bacterium]